MDGDCSHETKRYLFLGRKAMTNLDRVLKNRQHFKKQRHHFKKQRHHFAYKGLYAAAAAAKSL